MQPIFITGIGTGIGKTLAAAIVTEAIGACYWKPVQAGFEDGTDSEWVAARISRPEERVFPEAYKLIMPASPHIAAREEGVVIDTDKVVRYFERLCGATAGRSRASPGDRLTSPSGASRGDRPTSPSAGGNASGRVQPVVIEGAGGLLVPLNDHEFFPDLIRKLDATVLLVSRNYLGSINHSLLTANVCRNMGLHVAGWLFNDHYLHYEQEIAQWTGYPVIGSVPFTPDPDAAFIRSEAERLRPALLAALGVPA